MNSTMRIKRPLPPAPKPTRPVLIKNVTGTEHHLEVRTEKPPVVPGAKKRTHGVWGAEARETSVRRRVEARKQRIEEARRLYQQGMTVPQIAQHMEVQESTVYDYTRGIRKGLRKGNHEVDEDVIRMFNEGKTYKEIGDALDMTTANVSQKLTQLRKRKLVERRNNWSEH